MKKENILAARQRIKNYHIRTPLIPLERLETNLGFVPWVKLENLQSIGAFKIRGAMNAALSLDQDQLAQGLITASSGNHGRAVAHAAKLLGTKALILLPNTVSQLKKEAIEALGAKTQLVEPQKRIELAEKLAQEEDMYFIHPFNDPQVILGQASLGLEILEDLHQTKRILVPMGGGGLIAGISLAVKLFHPQVQVIGLEPAAVPKFSLNINEKEIKPVKEEASIADALLSNRPGSLSLEIVREHVDRIISVEEKYIKEGYKLLVEEGRVFCEPSSSIGFGALLQGEFQDQDMSDTVFLISGGNISPQDLAKLSK